MTWVRIDDQIYMHPKIVDAGNEAVGAWVRMLAWSAAHLTDGEVPRSVAVSLSEDPQIVAKLLRSGLLDDCQEGGDYTLHDFLDYNPSGHSVKAERRRRADSGHKGGKESASKRASTPQANAQASPQGERKESASKVQGEGQAKSNPVPVPVPVPVTAVGEESAAAAPPPPGSSAWFCDRMLDAGIGAVAPRWLPILYQLQPIDPKLVEAAIAKAREADGKPSPGLVIRILERWKSEPPAAAKAPTQGSEWQAAQARDAEQRKREAAKRRPPELEESQEERDRRLESGALSAKEILGKLGLGGEEP